MIGSQTPLVTIGMPTYNRADGYLKEAITSALGQTYKNLEIIVSDNCSTDGTDLFFKSIQDPRLTYVRQEQNIGPINNYNYCLQRAQGDYFLLLHDDDKIDNDFVATCMERCAYDKNYGIIRTGTRLIDDRGAILKEVPNRSPNLPTKEYLRGWFAGRTAWYLPSTLFNTAMLRDVGGFDPEFKLLPDLMVLVTLEARSKRFDIEEVKASFRVHPGEITFSARVEDWCDEFLILADLMCDLWPEYKDLIRTEGMEFFSDLNYKRADKVKSPFNRLHSQWTVYKKFSYRRRPPFARLSTYKSIRSLQSLLSYK